MDCLENLSTAYSFKIQCEFTDREFRKSILSSLQKHAALIIATKTKEMSTSHPRNDSVDAENVSVVQSDQCSSKSSPSTRNNSNHQAIAGPTKELIDDIPMDISPKVSECLALLPNEDIYTANECVNEEMSSIESVKQSLRSVRNPQFNRHNKNHGESRHQCAVCNRWFVKRYQLNLHHKICVKSLACSLCEKRFTSQIDLKWHVRIIHKQTNRHTCSTCQKTFDKLTSLRLHQSIHQAERKFGCDMCKQKFKSEIDLKMHKIRHLPTEYRLKRKQSPPKRSIGLVHNCMQ